MSNAVPRSYSEKAREKDREKSRRYRQRLRETGVEGVLFRLPARAIAMIDEIKERQGLPNRSQALLQLIEERGAGAQ